MQPIYNSGRGRSPDEAFGRLPKFIWADRYIKSDEYYNHEKDFCDNLMCGRRLVYSDKIGKMFCSECFSHLTKEETEALFAPNINAEDKVSDDIETGIIHPNEEGFIPMKRGGKSDAIAQREECETGGKTIARQPSRMEQLRAKKQAREFPGLDDDLRRTVAKAVVLSFRLTNTSPPP